MNRKPSDILPGLAIYLLVAVVAGVSIAMGAFPGKFDEWLSRSSNPRQALIFFSLMISSIVLVLMRGGIEINLLNMAKGENFKRYVSGLPLWVLLFGLAISGLGFWNYSPRCKSPESIEFHITGDPKTYLPLEVLEVSPNQSITITAKSPGDENLLSCISWEFAGPSFQSQGTKNGCDAAITFSEQPGSSYITLLVSQNFCNEASLFSLEVKLKESK